MGGGRLCRLSTLHTILPPGVSDLPTALRYLKYFSRNLPRFYTTYYSHLEILAKLNVRPLLTLVILETNLLQIQNLGSWATHFQVRIKFIFQVLAHIRNATAASESKAELQRHIRSKRHLHGFYSTIFLRKRISRDFSSN